MKLIPKMMLLCVFAFSASVQADDMSQNEQAARQVMKDFMTTFNARDENAWAATFHYPHVRFASEKVVIANDAADITNGMDFEVFATTTGWHHSAWDDISLINQGKNKVQFKVKFSRYKDDGSKLASYDSLYVVTLREGRWGIQARSSFAP